MDDITSNRHAGVVIVSLAILILGLVSTTVRCGSIAAAEHAAACHRDCSGAALDN